MRRIPILLTAVLVATACSSGRGTPAESPTVTGAGGPPERKAAALEVRVVPNPIVAIPVGESSYEFPFTVSIREVGGAPVTITRVGIDVYGVAGLRLYSSELGPAEIDRRGYHRTLAAGGEVRYSWRPRAQVPDARLFTTTWGELWVEGTDPNGAVSTRTRVTVRSRDLSP